MLSSLKFFKELLEKNDENVRNDLLDQDLKQTRLHLDSPENLRVLSSFNFFSHSQIDGAFGYRALQFVSAAEPIPLADARNLKKKIHLQKINIKTIGKLYYMKLS